MSCNPHSYSLCSHAYHYSFNAVRLQEVFLVTDTGGGGTDAIRSTFKGGSSCYDGLVHDSVPGCAAVMRSVGCRGVFLFEGTCILTPDVDYERFCTEVENCDAGVFCYGHYALKRKGPAWFCVKRVDMIPNWCARQEIIFENLHVSRFKHIDICLRDRV